jgi:hypothetical protein
MYPSTADNKAIRFRGLTDMFFSNPDAQATFTEEWTQIFHIDHPIHSKHNPSAELARKMMMAGFQGSREHFRNLITAQHPETLSLYRGQARFMQDDLACPRFTALSAKQKKKVSFTVAAEMIARNEAYSNLVELLLPNYVRLSIHAHSNRGPKFGVCLLPRSKVRAIDSVAQRHEVSPAYEFQVPTPWHNSMIKIEGSDVLFLGKAEIVQKALDEGDFEGGWVDDQALGGHFALRPTIAIKNSPTLAVESTAPIVTELKNESRTLVAESTPSVFTELKNEKQVFTVTIQTEEILTVVSAHDAGLVVQLGAQLSRVLELFKGVYEACYQKSAWSDRIML